MRISDWSSDVCSSDLQIYTPNGDYEPLINGKRRRIGLQGAFQWKPNPDLEIFAEAGYQEFRSLQQQRGLNNPTNGRAVDPDTVTLYEGTSDFKSGTFLDVPVTTYGVQRDTRSDDVVSGKGVSVSVDLGGRLIIKKKT